MEPVVMIHGGAWAIPDSLVEKTLLGVQKAAKAAWEILSAGGSALDAVEAAVVVLEDDPTFDAGTGAVLTSDGTVELDAMIMDGEHLNCGAVACVTNIKNPVKLARKVMERTDHVLLVGKGAKDFAVEIGIPTVSSEELVTPEAMEEWKRLAKFQKSVNVLFSERSDITKDHGHGHDTVGCVARDRNGNLASGTSTGGITAKRPGRVGDSPLVGSGGYADNASAAVSTTGHGESIAKVCLAKSIADKCEKGELPEEAIRASLKHMATRVSGAGGAICIDKNGRYGFAFTTERIAWALITDKCSTCGINPGESILFK